MKTSELTGAALDWAVATANGGHPQWDAEWGVFYQANGDDRNYSTDYSTNWAQGGPIIERELITVGPYFDADEKPTGVFQAYMGWDYENMEPLVQMDAETPLIAAMRCYVASKLGDEVEIPTELTSY